MRDNSDNEKQSPKISLNGQNIVWFLYDEVKDFLKISFFKMINSGLLHFKNTMINKNKLEDNHTDNHGVAIYLHHMSKPLWQAKLQKKSHRSLFF